MNRFAALLLMTSCLATSWGCRSGSELHADHADHTNQAHPTDHGGHGGRTDHGGQEHDDEHYERGPHGGRLLVDGPLTLEMTIFESGVPPQWRVYPYVDARPVDPASVAVEVTLQRLGERTTTIELAARSDYLTSREVVEEPHCFQATVRATYAGTSHRWSWSQVEAQVRMSQADAEAAAIRSVPAMPGTIQERLELPGEVGVNRDRMVHVSPLLAGVLVEASVVLGDRVQAGDTLAIVDSLELAEAKTAYIEAVHRLEFAQANYVREQALRQREISAERDYLRARHELEEAEISRQVGEQKLRALGVDDDTLADLAVEPSGRVVDGAVRAPFADRALTRFLVRAPVAGTIIDKHASPGETVARDDSLFVLADLSTVWVDVAVYPDVLARVRPGQAAVVQSRPTGLEAHGTVDWVDAMVVPGARSARARIVVPNPDGAWRPGMFVTVAILGDGVEARVVVPERAIQTWRERPCVFVRYGDVFEVRPVRLGRRDDRGVEILAGLDPGEPYAVENTFLLKADLGKAGASHDH